MTGALAGNAAGPSRLAVANARLVDGRRVAILVEAGRIVAVEAEPSLDGAQVIDAGGALVTAGLMNSATHLGLVEISSQLDDPLPAGAGPAPPEDVQWGLDPNSTLAPLARADGLTRAIAFPHRSDGALIAGAAAALRLSEGADILDRAQVAVFVTIGDVGANSPPTGSASAKWSGLRRRLDAARRLGELAPTDPLRADAEMLALAVADGVPLVIQSGREADIRQAASIARDYGLRTVVFGGAEAWRAADVLAAEELPVVLNPFDNLPANVDMMGARLENAALLHAAGVRIAFAVPGIHLSHNAGSALREAAGLAVANGLPWTAALTALTAAPAQIFGLDDHYGAIAVGLDADLVIWDGDPLEPSAAPLEVIVRGRPVSRTTRQSRLADRYHPRHRDAPWPAAYR